MRCFKDERELTDTVAELKKYTSKLPQKMTDLESKLNSIIKILLFAATKLYILGGNSEKIDFISTVWIIIQFENLNNFKL